MITCWPCPTPHAVAGAAEGADRAAGLATEYALTCDRGRAMRLLIVPALFDEGNRLRRFTVETLRALDAAGIDAMLPDLPGTNESEQPLAAQSLVGWQAAMTAAAAHFQATHVLAIRGGGLVAPALPGWAYAPVGGSTLVRQMVRMRLLAAREAGREERQDDLLAAGRVEGLDIAGYELGPALLAGLLEAVPAGQLTAISQSDIGGAGLWLRAEPGENAEQSRALAARISAGLAA